MRAQPGLPVFRGLSPGNKPFGNKWLILCMLVVIATAGVFLFRGGHPAVYYISFYEGRSEEILYRQQVEIEDILILNYIHSADATPISALFEISENGLYLVEERYSWYGAGLESGAGHHFTFENKEVTVSGYDRLFETLPVRVARTVPQTVLLGDETITLNELAPGGTLLIIRVDQH